MICIITTSLSCTSATQEAATQNLTTHESAIVERLIQEMNFDELSQYLATQSSEVIVLNFWATWCVPCVEELHFFERLDDETSDDEVRVILVSLDFPTSKMKSLIPFINRRNLKTEVILLDDPKMNVWIDKVSPEWSGAIPATWYIIKDNKLFHEGKYSDYSEIINSISQLKN